MKKYMIVYRTDKGITSAVFFDERDKAENFRMNCEVGMGWYAEFYERADGEYVFLYA